MQRCAAGSSCVKPSGSSGHKLHFGMAIKRRKVQLHCQKCSSPLCGPDCLKAHVMKHHRSDLSELDATWATDKSIFTKDGEFCTSVFYAL